MQIFNVSPRSYLRLLLFPALCLLAGVVLNIFLSRQFQDKVIPRQTDEFLKMRMQSFIQKIPALMNGDRYAFFWGASEIESGLDTEVIDKIFVEKGMDLKAVNVGMRSVHPTAYRAFAHRVADILESRNQKIEVSFVKFPANKLTRTFGVTFPPATQNGQVGLFLDLTNWEFARSRPVNYIGGLFSHYVLADTNLNVLSEWGENVARNFFPQSAEQIYKMHYFAPWFYPVFLERDVWRLDIRGSTRFNLPYSKKYYDQMVINKQSQKVRYTSYAYFEKCCGMNDLKFDPDLVRDFIATLKDIQRMSKKVYLYDIPETEEFNLWRKNNFRERIERILTRVQDEVDVEIIDTANVRLNSDAYLDFLHLNLKGQAEFYPILFDRLTSAQ